MFEFDIQDVEENIGGFEKWNPKIKKLMEAIQNEKMLELDSITDKLHATVRYIFFNQRTTTILEKLTHSNIDLVGNSTLINKLFLYKDEQVGRILEWERRYNIVDEELKRYYSQKVYGDFYRDGINYVDLQKDKYYLSLIGQKYQENANMTYYYKLMLEKQLEIKELLEKEIEKNCN